MRLPDDDVEDLRLIAEYHTACRSLRRIGWGGIAFGFFNIVLGVVFIIFLHPINAILVFIGLLLLGSGVWCLAAPGAEGVICNGIALILVGVWNVFVTVINMTAGRTPQVWWAVFGAVMIAAGVQCIQKYARFSQALRNKATAKEMAMMDRLVQSILKAKPKEDEDIITFDVPGWPQQKSWIGELRRDGIAVFVDKMSKEVMVAHKEEIRIEPHGKVLLGKTLKTSVEVADYKAKAQISPTAFDRFRDWKFADDEDEYYADEEAEGDEREPERGIRRKDDRGRTDERDPERRTDIREAKDRRRDPKE
jgi:hypothetical protein